MAQISFGGLSSGLDINSIVDKLVAVDSQPLTTIKNRQETIKNQKELWNDINSKMLSLKESLEKVSKTILDGSFSTNISNESILNASVFGEAISGTYSVNVSQLAQNLVVRGDKFEGAINKTGKVIINDGKKDLEIEIEENDTVESISKKINNSNGDISSYVIDGALVLSHKKCGDDSKITIVDNDDIFKDLGVLNDDNSFKNISQEAQVAKVSVNGIEVTKNSNTITDIIPGINLNLKDIGNTRLVVEDNEDEVIDSIKNFISSYNETVLFINEKLSEEKPDSTSLTNKKQGLLRGNSALNQIRSKLRTSVLGSISNSGEFKQLYQIGIDSSKDNYGKDGTLQLLDETKLRDMLKTNREDVAKLFIEDADDNNKISQNDKGLFSYLNSYIEELTSTNSSKKGSIIESMDSLEQKIKNLDKDIERKELLIEAKRQRYEKQFNAMEVRLSNINANGEYLLNNLSSLMG